MGNFKNVIIETLCCFLFFTHATESDQINLHKDIQRELVNLNGTLYYINPPPQKYSAMDAVRFCNDVGMRLFSLQTEEKQTMIANYLDENGHIFRSFWTSGAQYAPDFYVWSGAGEAFTFTNWFPGQPNIRADDVCVYLDFDKSWMDKDCNDLHSLICEQIKNC